MRKRASFIRMVIVLTISMLIWFIPNISDAHCDTLQGPVVTSAMEALEKGDVTPVLKWVKREYEDEVKEAFKKTSAVRKQGKEAKDLADMYFFETLVRLHRQGEGAPYTGLKLENPEPIIIEADKAIESGSVDTLIKHITSLIAGGIKEHFSNIKETKKHTNESVEAGRKFVEAYVKFIHYVEKLYIDAISKDLHHEEKKSISEEHHH